MKHTIPLTLIAALALSAISTPAFAGQTDTKTDIEVVQEMKDDLKVQSKSEMNKAERDMSVMDDDKSTGMHKTAPAMKLPEVGIDTKNTPASTPIIKPDIEIDMPEVKIYCPEGTSVQDDGTCMISGDYDIKP